MSQATPISTPLPPFQPRCAALLKALVLPLLLASCAAVPPSGAEAPVLGVEDATTAAAATPEPTSGSLLALPAEPAEPEYGNFAEDVLTRTILAELAGQRGQSQESLDEYLVLARETGDLNVIQRTMRIAVFLRNVEATLEMANLWLDVEPESIEARQTIAIQMITLGRYRDAVEQFTTLLAQGSRVDFRIISARLTNDTNAPLIIDALISDFAALLTRYPDNDSLKLGLAQLYQQDEQFAAAYAIVAPLAKELDDRPEVVLMEVQLLESLDDAEGAQERLAEAIETHPDNRQLRFMYGRKLITQQRFEDAREQFQIIVQQDPSDFDIVYSLALLSMEVNQFDEARAYLNRLVINGKRLDDAHYYLGHINALVDDTGAAIEHYLRVTGGSNFLLAQRHLTELMVRVGRYAEVKSHLQNVRFRNADYSIPLLTMEANVLMDEGKIEDAAVLLDSSIGTFPDDIQLLFLRSVLSQTRNDLPLMEQDLRKIIALEPNSPMAYNSLGYTLADRTNRHQEAYELIQRALELSPDDPSIIDSLGWVQYRLGMYEEAQKNLTRAYELFPDHEVAAHLGEVLWVLGEHDEATRVWRNALQVVPNSVHIINAMERLDAGASI